MHNSGSVIGTPLLKALQSKVGAGKVAYQGVPYPASAAVSIFPVTDVKLLLIFVAGQCQWRW